MTSYEPEYLLKTFPFLYYALNKLVCTVKIVSIEKAGRRNSVYGRKKEKKGGKDEEQLFQHFPMLLLIFLISNFVIFSSTSQKSTKQISTMAK